MEFWLTDGDGRRLRFPMAPERVTAETGARTQTYELLELGELEVPRGQKVARITWEGRFPGEPRRNASYVHAWRHPIELIDQLVEWRSRGSVLCLLITNTPLNLDVFIGRFRHEWGRLGDAEYSLDLVQHRALQIYTDAQWQAAGASHTLTRPVAPAPKTYSIQSGDTLWIIAKRFLGDGSRWQEVYTANRETIGPDPNLIHPGTLLLVPGAEV